MFRDLYKHTDRLLTFERKRRPGTEMYWKLMSEVERNFAHSIITLLSQNFHPDFRLVVTLMGSMSRYYDHHLLRAIGLPPRKPQDIDLMITADPKNDKVNTRDFNRKPEYQRLSQLLAQFYLSQSLPYTKEVAHSAYSESTTTAVQFITEPNPAIQLRSFDIVLFRLFGHESTWTADLAAKQFKTAGVRLADKRDPAFVAQNNKKLDDKHREDQQFAEMYLSM